MTKVNPGRSYPLETPRWSRRCGPPWPGPRDAGCRLTATTTTKAWRKMSRSGRFHSLRSRGWACDTEPGAGGFPLHPRSPAKSQGSGKELSVELQILSHLGTG